jgi:IS30 family transposase
MSTYKHLKRDDRVRLAALLRAGHSQKECAGQLGVSTGTISRELAKNSGTEGYRALDVEHRKSDRRQKANARFAKIRTQGWLISCIIRNLKKRRSPEQVAGTLKRSRGKTISHESIYEWIYAYRPDLKKYLRQKKGRYRRRGGTKRREKAREEGKKRRIDTRPAAVERRSRIGDWEGDTIVGTGQSGRILTYVDRKSGYLIAALIKSGSANLVLKTTVELFSRIPQKKRRTLTLDNGIEFSAYELIERDTGLIIYFAFPYHSWERGTNENTNGLLREYFPKKMSFAHLTQHDIDIAVKELNDRPRKRLGYATPREAFAA